MFAGSFYRTATVWIAAAALLVPAAQKPARADQLKLSAALGNPVLKAGHKQTTYLKVSLTGFRLKSDRERAPVNVAIVIDTSGSMQGEKIQKAREAAIMAIQRLSARDIVSVVAYNNSVQVLVPATKLSERDAVEGAIRRLEAGGSTALFAGVSKGAAELRKFLDKNRVNRVILLSDGIANVGPSSPTELGQLGASLIKEGVSVTTIGLGTGYNEDLMSRLAEKSDGNHYFAENTSDLARVFRSELGDVLTVVAQEVIVKIRCADGVRPVRALGREADITGQDVAALINQVYSEQTKYLLLEIEVPAMQAGQTLQVAKVNVSYGNMQTRTTDVLTSALSARYSDSDAAIAARTNKAVMVAAVEQLATLRNVAAMKLRDEGRIDEARKLLVKNSIYLEKNARQYDAEELKEYSRVQEDDADNLEGEKWDTRRKRMVETQQGMRAQQKARK